MSWKYFAGACILAGGLLVKFGAPIVPVAAGMIIAGLVHRYRQHRAAGSPP